MTFARADGKDIDAKWLCAHGFSYDRKRSDREHGVRAYKIRFPVYRRGLRMWLDASLSAVAGGMVRADMYDAGTDARYAPFYCAECADAPGAPLRIARAEIGKKAAKLGLREYAPRGMGDE